jgi:FdhD protein
MAGSRTRAPVLAVEEGRARSTRQDSLAVEEPMAIRLRVGGRARPVAVTMRTPGDDFELAAGFLHAEGVVREREAIRAIRYCREGEVAPEERYNVVTVELREGTPVDLPALERHFLTSSACGVCGKGELEALRLRCPEPPAAGPRVEPEVLHRLPELLRSGQRGFEATGGLHAAGLFTAAGGLVAVREDVGRHNALDKLLGWALLEGRLPLHDHLVLVSGRSSWELAQKCLVAGVPLLASVSAPSSLAVDLARDFGMTLVGFLRGRRFNVYAGPERIATS